jgi:hypothetical protein
MATDAAAIELTARIDQLPAARPPIPPAAAMLNCKMEPYKLSMIPEASGAITTKLNCRPGPDDHAGHVDGQVTRSICQLRIDNAHGYEEHADTLRLLRQRG